jgi:predicted nucleic acid-binding protein
VIIVVDASVAVKWVAPEPTAEGNLDEALAVLGAIRRREVAFVQPAHWLFEVAAVLVRARPRFVDESLKLLAFIRVSLADDAAILRRALRLAEELDHHLFDTLYHAVALERQGVLVTADGRYARKSAHLGRIVELRHWTGSLAAQ